MFARNLVPNATTWLPQQLFSDVLASFWLQTACPVTRKRLSGGHYRQPLRLLYGAVSHIYDSKELNSLPGRRQLWRVHARRKDRVSVQRFVAGGGVTRGALVGGVPSPSRPHHHGQPALYIASWSPSCGNAAG